uniref:Ubiquitin carboxyl-terminal hydrolase n=1 Tax=Romanomermis culicivorax TaxID=13658 RepID=A0A915K1C4_ROMCU
MNANQPHQQSTEPSNLIVFSDDERSKSSSNADPSSTNTATPMFLDMQVFKPRLDEGDTTELQPDVAIIQGGPSSSHQNEQVEIYCGDTLPPTEDTFEATESVRKTCEPSTPAPISVPSSSQAIEITSTDDFSSSQKSVASDLIHQVKWVPWHGRKTPIITQNENGPCPLLAIMNVLLLRGQITIPDTLDFLTTEKLLERLGDCILRLIPLDISQRPDFQQNMNDSLYILPKLSTGIDVNVRFTGVNEFEYTPECIIFDLLNIHLYHGWIVDASSDHGQTAAAVGTCTYNQLVEKIIDNKTSSDSLKITQAVLAEQFLDATASQLTAYGLKALHNHLRENELAVFFRNNHFSTIMKHEGKLLLLVTDQGFLNEADVIWETLENVSGDNQFLNENFAIVPPKAVHEPFEGVASEATTSDVSKQIENDLMYAMSLEHELRDQGGARPSTSSETDDHSLALKLQQEENNILSSSSTQTTPGDTQAPPPSSQQESAEQRKKKCSLL